MNLFFLFASFSCLFFKVSYRTAGDKHPAVVYIIKYSAVAPGSNNEQKMLPDDSIFCYRSFGLEQMAGIDQSTFGSNTTTKETLKKSNLIDFKNDLFLQLDVQKPDVSQKPRWLPLKDKQIGYQPGFIYIDKEKPVIKDTVIRNENFRIIRFLVEQNNAHKGAMMTFFLKPDLDSPVFFLDIEKRYGQKVKAIIAQYPNNGGVVHIAVEKRAVSESCSAIVLIKQLLLKAGK